MKKIILNTIEDKKYQVIKKLVESNGNKLKAALKLQVTPRTIDRLILKYKKIGKEAFIHGNRNRKPKHSMSFEEKEKIVSLYKEKYFDCNIQHFTELLADREGIKRDASTLLKLLKEYDILSVKAHKKTKKAFRKKLKEKAKNQEESDNKNVFENQLTKKEINLNLSVLSKRKVDSGCCISYKNMYYRLEDEKGELRNFRKGTEVTVIQSFDKKLYGNVSDKLYILVEVPKEEKESRYFGVKEEVKKEKKKYIPALEHPWKKKSFEKYLEKQERKKEKEEYIK